MNDEFIDLDNNGQLNDILKKLDKGERVKVRINGQETEYFNPPEAVPICEQHDLKFMNKEGEHYEAVLCKNCINGRIIDIRTHKLVDGVIVKK